MVGIVSGSSVGLNLSTLAKAGQRGDFGTAEQGKTGEQSFVNIATGNLVISDKDNFLASVGNDASVIRTYNSLGVFKDANNTNWWMSGYRQLTNFTGATNAINSSLTKVCQDGSPLIFTYDATSGNYLAQSVSGQYESLHLDANGWRWTSADGKKSEV